MKILLFSCILVFISVGGAAQFYQKKMEYVDAKPNITKSEDFNFHMPGIKSVAMVYKGVEADWKPLKYIYEFDKKGRLIKKHHPTGGWTGYEYTFSTENQLLEITIIREDTLTKTNYQYDKKSRLKKVFTNSKLTKEYIYAKANDSIQCVKSYKNGKLKELKKYEYDQKNRLIKITLKDSIPYKEYEYFETTDSIRSIKTYRAGELYQLSEYKYKIFPNEPSGFNDFSYVEYEARKLFHTGAPKENHHFYYNKNHKLGKIVASETSIYDTTYFITTIKYNEVGKIIQISDHLTNDSGSGYEDRYYSEEGYLSEVIWRTDNGLTKTKEWTYTYQFH